MNFYLTPLILVISQAPLLHDIHVTVENKTALHIQQKEEFRIQLPESQ